MPAVVVIIPALATIGRVKCYSGTFISGGICCGLVAILSFALEKGSKYNLTIKLQVSI
jgi:hypothetical protein